MVIKINKDKINDDTTYTLIEIFWSDLTFKQQSSRIYCSAGNPVLLLSRTECSKVALECLQSGKSRNFVAYMSNLTTKFLSVLLLIYYLFIFIIQEVIRGYEKQIDLKRRN